MKKILLTTAVVAALVIDSVFTATAVSGNGDGNPVNSPPVIESVDADPDRLWPPNRKPVDVTITIVATDPDGLEDIVRTTYSVIDEYGEFDVMETDLPEDGIIFFMAERNGNDKDGRRYIVFLTVYDSGGLADSTILDIIVAHSKKSLGGPQYGGTYNYASATNWVYFDEVAGGNYGGHVYAQAPHFTNNELLQGDWMKGPAGTGETNWINGGDNRMDQKAGCIAHSWQIPERGTMIFHIRDDVYWHDKEPANGRQLVPDDIVWSMNRALSGGYFLYAYPSLGQTIEMTADNDAWTVTMTVPVSEWVNLITLLPDYTSIANREAVELWGDQVDWEHSLGTGPFILTDWVSNSKATLVRNPNYWETNPGGPGMGDQLPYLDQYEVLIIPDPATREAAFRVGLINSLSGTNYNDAMPLISDPDLAAINWVEYIPDGTNSLFFRTDLTVSPFYHKEIRQAMMLAIDQPQIRDQYWQGHAEIVGWPVTPTPAYRAAMMDETELPANVAALYGRDLAAAQALLASSPYPGGFACSVICWNTPVMIDILTQYQAMLADININMTLDVVDYAVYTSRLRSRNHGPFEIMYGTASGNGAYMKMINMRGPSSYNVSYINEDYSVPEIEAAYAAMQPYVGINEAAMMTIHKGLMPWLLEQAYVINSPVPSYYNLWWPWVKNYYGCSYVGYYNSYGTAKYLWLDEDLKEAMGY